MDLLTLEEEGALALAPSLETGDVGLHAGLSCIKQGACSLRHLY